MDEDRLELVFWSVLLIVAVLLMWRWPQVQFIGVPIQIREDNQVMSDDNWPKVLAWIVSLAICVGLMLMFSR